ncbi:hypothetical protein LZK98_08245 [Sphingomonas cannabina]|uniref:hypothetical protein n=1 Tax=Sphingomonas cannabina TaxID=2899123 RepID=UPI001F1E70B2|nr:hypothetical protein [Sphingomonas cannabina]UIJ46919.1 hypothetical protein LZK98_08245 [Sphingomonas cannabina]
MWNALLGADAPLSAPDFAALTGADLCAIHKPLRAWAGAGIILKIDGRPQRYLMAAQTERSLTPPTVHHDGRIAIRPRSSREKIWSAIRVLKTFDVPQLMLVCGVKRGQVLEFLSALDQAGYVRRHPCQAGESPRYTLLHRSGPRPPSITRSLSGGRWTRTLVDPNTGARVPLAGRPNTSSAPRAGGVVG